jgi:hypothetical protein
MIATLAISYNWPKKHLKEKVEKEHNYAWFKTRGETKFEHIMHFVENIKCQISCLEPRIETIIIIILFWNLGFVLWISFELGRSDYT